MQGLHKILLYHFLTCLGQNGHGSKIINGQKVPENSMLYMVSVHNNRGHVCGGSLVSDQHVLTAALCDKKNASHIFLGTHSVKENVNPYYVERKVIPRTKNGKVIDDIMLLTLHKKVELGNSVQTIPLPESNSEVKENEQCQVAGWGKTSTYCRIVDELRMVDLSVIDQQVCKEKWPDIPPNVICAGGYGTNKGFCKGDSGGPLVCNGVAVGVASVTEKFNCDHPDVPNICTNISKHLHWIRKIIHQTKELE
ncbi:mast cell protease 3-like [Channa argus]|uniref:mast cell protease 3-like n=1 Tax=Channa argus TaxID=215402 RepID=UPI003521A03F